MKYLFGPVASRRLGLSLGVDTVPMKTCSYDCVYCELGRTTTKTIERQSFFPPEEIIAELRDFLSKRPRLDYVTFSGSGEPTLNRDLGILIREAKRLSPFPIAVLTNGSLLWREGVQQGLMEADLVIPSIDAGSEEVFHRINRPAGKLRLDVIARGIANFTRKFGGDIWVEVLICNGINDSEEEIERLARLVVAIGAEKVQLTTVFRPPAEPFAEPVTERFLRSILSKFGPNAEIVGVPRTRKTVAMKDIEGQILKLVRRRPSPISEIEMSTGMSRAETIKTLELMRRKGSIKKINHKDEDFYTASKETT